MREIGLLTLQQTLGLLEHFVPLISRNLGLRDIVQHFLTRLERLEFLTSRCSRHKIV